MSFRHADHVELGWRLLGERSFEAAFAELERRLRALAAAAGRPEKYDAAMTRAYLQIIDERRGSGERGEDWAAFAARNRDLFADGNERGYDSICRSFDLSLRRS